MLHKVGAMGVRFIGSWAIIEASLWSSVAICRVAPVLSSGERVPLGILLISAYIHNTISLDSRLWKVCNQEVIEI